jgi:poly(3-hydroxybutyrate) depolymerase
MAIKHNMYNVYEMHHMVVSPWRTAANVMQRMYDSPFNPYHSNPLTRTASAGLEVFERLTRKYTKPEFGIIATKVNGKEVKITQKTVLQKSFCNLVHFEKKGNIKQPKLMIVAPMSGHYATLLRGTVEDALPYFDVYITDWVNPRDVPMTDGYFDLDDYIDYVIEFTEFLKGDVHIMGVCQPVVPIAAAVSIMEHEGNKYSPKSMILVGGPIDGRINPTMVNDLADKKSIEWFEQNLITRVPFNYKGFMRPVYPGFLQLAGFISMKPEQHAQKHHDYFNHLIIGDEDSAEKHEKFYDEYLSVMDLTAEFYLQTIKTVFQDFALPLGKMKSRGRPVNMANIRRTALLALEGEKDDIAGVGQSKAALTLSKNLPEKMKQYHLQPDVGHYGIFSGSKYREHIVPIMRDFVKKHD